MERYVGHNRDLGIFSFNFLVTEPKSDASTQVISEICKLLKKVTIQPNKLALLSPSLQTVTRNF